MNAELAWRDAPVDAEANPTSAASVTLDRKTTYGANGSKLACDCGCTADCHKRTQARHHDDNMIHAFNHLVFVDDPDDGFTMFVGADTSGNLWEVGVIDSVDGPIIIHAMPARPKYLR